jgi:hypothetical protein
MVSPMIAWRVFIAGSILLVVGLSSAEEAQAQQGYEFGIRFRPINFRPTNFERFSFSGYGFRPTSAQSIQFNQIRFPAFNSRMMRRDFESARDRGRSDQSITFQARHDRSDPGVRLSQVRKHGISTLSDRRRRGNAPRLGVRHLPPERTGQLARGESNRSVSSRSSRIAGSRQLVGASSRTAKRRPASTGVRSASRLRGDVFSSTATR